MTKIYFQGDMLLECVDNTPDADCADTITPDPDGSVVIGRGEVTGHRHRFAIEDRVTMFRDESLALDIPTQLYVGHVNVGAAGASLLHEEHDTIILPTGTYRVRRQREFDCGEARVVAD